MSLLEKIQNLCKEEGINPSKLEIELGFGKGTLYKWDKSSPNTDKLSKVADHFNVSVDWLLGKTEFRSQEAMWNSFDKKFPNVCETDNVYTIAAHHEGDWSEEELEEIEKFKEFVRMKRKK